MRLPDKNASLIKHTSAIQMSNNVSLLARKTWNVFVWNAYPYLKKTEIGQFEIRKSILKQILKIKSNDDQILKNAVESLTATRAKFNVLGKDDGSWDEIAVLLADASFTKKRGYIVYGLSSLLREKLAEPAVYAKINLYLQSLFQKKYALALWENLTPYYNQAKGYGTTEWFDVDTLRAILGVEPHEYTEFKDFAKHVIRKGALEEMNKMAMFKVDPKAGVKYKRVNRKVAQIKFCMVKNPENIIEKEEVEKKVNKYEQLTIPINNSIDNPILFKELTEDYGVFDKIAEELMITKTEDEIRGALKKIDSKFEKGEIPPEALGGYTAKTIQNWKKPKMVVEKEKREQEQKEKISKSKKTKQVL